MQELAQNLDDPTMPTAQRVAEMFREVVAQDQWALERQQTMMEFPDDECSELFLKTEGFASRRQILMGLQRKERELQMSPADKPTAVKEPVTT